MLKPAAGRGHQHRGKKKKRKNYQKRNNSHEYSSVRLSRVKDGATGTSVNASLYSALFSQTLPHGGAPSMSHDNSWPGQSVPSRLLGVWAPNGFWEGIKLRSRRLGAERRAPPIMRFDGMYGDSDEAKAGGWALAHSPIRRSVHSWVIGFRVWNVP